MFRMFGFDVAVRPGFLIFTALIVFVYQDAFGVWLAGALAVFTLLHELGHALAARNSGADASISLDFMAGYTSFRPRIPLTKWRRVFISIAGPATQIIVSVGVLVAMGVNPFDLDSVGEQDATAAIWWAGPAIGLINLIPVLPLDGGHIAQTGLEAALRRPALREMVFASLVVTIGAGVTIALTGHTGFMLFLAFLLITQLQLLQATSRKPRQPAPRSTTWHSDEPWMQSGVAQRSPWQLAHQALATGDRDAAARIMLLDLQSSGGKPWVPPYSAPRADLAAIVDVLPATLPPGNAYSEVVLVQVMYALGQVARSGEYAADCFSRHRTPLFATVVARAAAKMGDQENALLWVRAASDTDVEFEPGERLAAAQVLDNAPELEQLRTRPEFQAARAGIG